jgi:integrase
MLAQTKRRPKRAARKQRITQLTVTKASRPTKAFLTWDTKAPNLALRTQPTGRKSWVVVYPHHGRSRWLTLGNAASIPLASARIMASEAMLKVAKGGDPAADRKAERGAGTFAELAAKYLEQHAKRQNKSWRQADALVRRHAIPRWGKLQASSVTRDDVKTMMARIEAPILANQVLAAMSAIFTWGLKEGHVSANPCKLVERNPTTSRERVLADSEFPKFWSAFGDLDPIRGAALKAILLSGQRPGEIANMRVEHIKDGWWEMPGAPIPGVWPGTKNGESHRVWLSQPLQALLADLCTGDVGFVFAGSRGHPVHGLDAAMRTICAKLGIERATPHDLRRTFGSKVTGLGFGRDAMNRILNHSTDDEVGDVYDRHGYADENKRIMETVAAKIVALVEGGAADKFSRSSDPRAGESNIYCVIHDVPLCSRV